MSATGLIARLQSLTLKDWRPSGDDRISIRGLRVESGPKSVLGRTVVVQLTTKQAQLLAAELGGLLAD